MEWLRDVWPLSTIVFGFIALCGVCAWLSRCSHPNPHYRRQVLYRDPMTESDEVIEPASYVCYECGKTWSATVRDPAIRDVHLLRKRPDARAGRSGGVHAGVNRARPVEQALALDIIEARDRII